MPLTIREQSDKLKAAATERLPAEVLEVFNRSIQNSLRPRCPDRKHQGGRRARSDHPQGRHRESGQPCQLVENGQAVIVLYRGGWCPYCDLTLRASQQELLPQLGALGCPTGRHQPAVARRVALHGGKAALGFTVLSDPGLDWPMGSASRSTNLTRFWPPTRPRTRPDEGERQGCRPPARPTVLVVDRIAPCASSTLSPTTPPARGGRDHRHAHRPDIGPGDRDTVGSAKRLMAAQPLASQVSLAGVDRSHHTVGLPRFNATATFLGLG